MFDKLSCKLRTNWFDDDVKPSPPYIELLFPRLAPFREGASGLNEEDRSCRGWPNNNNGSI
jgi:hypothetical protein